MGTRISIQKELIFGWEGYRISAGDISLGVTPSIGGRIMSLTFQGEELFFSDKKYHGNSYHFKNIDDLILKKNEFGFRLFGGDKTWVSPQSSWWEKIPPLELDAASYEAEVGDNFISMLSPICRETFLQVFRRIQINLDGTILLKQSFCNTTDAPIQKGIWNVTQLLRPFDIYFNANYKDVVAYHDEGLIEDATHKITQHNDLVKISCDDQTHFKFGSKVNIGQVNAVRGNVNFERTFFIDPKAKYAHNAMVEIYNSKDHNYCEVEVHAPLVEISPGEQVTHQQTWKIYNT